MPTASGYVPVVGTTIAAPRNIPFGTRVYIPTLKSWRIVQDRTARRYDGRWDIFVKTHREAKHFGKRKLEIWIEQKREQERD
jgi:3D (Asp-Asp-Asp) domain-containing protein